MNGILDGGFSGVGNGGVDLGEGLVAGMLVGWCWDLVGEGVVVVKAGAISCGEENGARSRGEDGGATGCEEEDCVGFLVGDVAVGETIGAG